MSPEEQLWWLRLNRAGLSPQRQRQLLNAFGSPAAIFEATDEALLRLSGFTEMHLSKLRQGQRSAQPERDLWKLERMGAWLLTIFDDRYPPLLRQLPDAPPLLYVLGTMEPQDERLIAVVGTRRHPSMEGALPTRLLQSWRQPASPSSAGSPRALTPPPIKERWTLEGAP